MTLIRSVAILALLVLQIGIAGCRRPVAHDAPPAPEDASRLDKLVEQLYSKGSFREAVPHATKSVALHEQLQGAMHPDLATSLRNLAALHVALDEYADAEPLLDRALDIRNKALGASDLAVAESLSDLAWLYHAEQRYEKAEPLLIRALEIRETALGASHREVATSLNNLALLHGAKGEYAKARSLLMRALAIRVTVLGASHREVATSLNNLAVVHAKQGEIAKARALYLRALEIYEKVLGPTHLDVANCLDNLVSLDCAQNACQNAKPLLVRALAIRQQAPGAQRAGAADRLQDLTRFYRARGADAKAQLLQQIALDLGEPWAGAEAAVGLDDRAEPELEQARRVALRLATGQTVAAVIDGYMFDTYRYRIQIPSAGRADSSTAPEVAVDRMPTTGLQLWLRSDAGTFVTGGRVVRWLDQSGQGRNAAMSNPSRRPSFVAAALNGLPVVRFQGKQSLAFDKLVDPASFSVFVVGKNNQRLETFSMILGPGGNSPNNQLRWENGSEVLFVGTGNDLPSTRSSIGDTRVYHALSATYDRTTMSVYRDGKRTSSHRFQTTGPWALASLGSYYSSEFMDGELAEVIVYDRVLPEGERKFVNRYLRDKYKLP
jgi:tetratricopeptide (TPR) repeat protein